jgi:hypothetical protein
MKEKSDEMPSSENFRSLIDEFDNGIRETLEEDNHYGKSTISYLQTEQKSRCCFHIVS